MEVLLRDEIAAIALEAKAKTDHGIENPAFGRSGTIRTPLHVMLEVVTKRSGKIRRS